jgi:NADH dehydrogenase
MERKQVLVLGGGFGGLTFCQHFKNQRADVTLIDRQNHHLFQPLLYQVATAGLSAPDIAQPIRRILHDRENVLVLMDNVLEVRLPERKVVMEKETLSYDYLIMALGGRTTYFGHPEWETFAPGLKTLDDALRIRRDILFSFERAERTEDPAVREQLMTIVVVGGGPTGVELAGAFAELARYVLYRDFRKIDSRKARVIIIEASPVVLSHLPLNLANSAQHQLEKMGVEVRTNTRVTALSKGRVETTSGTIYAETVIWAAGVGATPLTEKMGVPIDRAGRIKVLPDLSVPGFPNVFAIGDMASLVDKNGILVPGVSPAAMQEARHVARIIDDELNLPGRKLERPPFAYFDKGTMATIGRSAAVAKMGDLEFSGFTAWLAWLGVHLLFLVGFRNKISVLMQWAYSYLAYKRGSRIITGMSLQKISHPQATTPQGINAGAQPASMPAVKGQSPSPSPSVPP